MATDYHTELVKALRENAEREANFDLSLYKLARVSDLAADAIESLERELEKWKRMDRAVGAALDPDQERQVAADRTDQIGRLRALAQRAHPGNGAQVHVEELVRAADAIELLERERDNCRANFEEMKEELAATVKERDELFSAGIKQATVLEEALAKVYGRRSVAIAELCDEHLDRSGALLGRVRALALQYSREQAEGETDAN